MVIIVVRPFSFLSSFFFFFSSDLVQCRHFSAREEKKEATCNHDLFVVSFQVLRPKKNEGCVSKFRSGLNVSGGLELESNRIGYNAIHVQYM